MSFLKVRGLTCRVGSFVLEDISFDVEKGEFLSVIGKSGSGKTVLLESIAGLHKVRGSIELGGVDITSLPPEKRGIGIVYQDYMLFPNMNVKKNILYPALFKRMEYKLFDEVIGFLGIENILSRDVRTLSGGEKQKVAIARALLSSPKILLLDEPLNAIDFTFKLSFMEFLKDLHTRYELTVLYVTHNFKEALFLSDNTIVLLNGRLRQYGRIADVFKHPASRDVAAFLGFKNILPASMIGGGERRYFSVSPYAVELLDTEAINKDYVFRAELLSVRDLKTYWQIKVKVNESCIFIHKNPGVGSLGNNVYVGFNRKDLTFFD